MVDVCMAQNYRVHRGGIERQMKIALLGLGAMPLKEATVKQDALAVDFEQVHRAGHFSCRTKKSEPHR